MADEAERRSSATADEAHAWFDEHGADAAGLSMLLDTTRAFPTVTWEEFAQVLLCHGWIDGRSNRLDDTGHLIRTTPAAPPGARPAVDAPTRSEQYAVLPRVHTERTASGRGPTIADRVGRVTTGKPL